MSDYIALATKVILSGQGIVALRHDEAAAYARLLDAAGLIASPAHDAAVAAKAWREGFTTGQSRAMRHMSDEPLLPLSAPSPYEREGGAS